MTIRVLADDREKVAVIDALRALPDVEVEIRRLVLGDYLVGDAVLFERKTLADMAASIRDGRVFAQGRRLVAHAKPAALILEGTAQDLCKIRFPRRAFQGAIISLSLVIGLPILRSRTPGETATLMMYAGRQVRTVLNGTLPYRGFRARGKKGAQLRLLQDLPGVGSQRAVNLLHAFGSVEAVMMADEYDLVEVPGIGADTAKKIRRLVSESRAEYHCTNAA